MPKLIRITTAPISLNVLLPGQMSYMKQQGMEVIMVSSDGPELKTVLDREGCPHHIVPMSRKMSPLSDVKCLWMLYRFFKKEKPDIVHSHTPKAGLLAMLAAKFAGVKIRVHTIAGLRYVTTKGFTRKVLLFMEKLTGRAATHVWPNSFSLKEYIEKNKLVKPSKLEVIGKGSSNGIDLTRYSLTSMSLDKLIEIKKKIHYDTQLIYFLSVGRIVHDKGMDELLGAFIKLYEDNSSLRLILVGSFEDEVDPVSEETRKLIMTHPGVIQAGWSNEVEYYMSFAFALVHPSHREGFPNVLLQAGAMMCPIVCSRIDGNVDIVSDNVTGFISEVKDQDSLYHKMQQALNSPELLKTFTKTLRKNIEENFDQPMVHQLLYQKYMSLVS